MAKLSERLKDAEDNVRMLFNDHAPSRWKRTAQAITDAAAVCAAVEAFQAAEQALREAQRKQPFSEADWAAAVRGGEAAKARLLEVNLG